MGLQLTFSNIVQLFSVFAPLFLGTFLVLVSVFNQNIKGVIYLGGVLIATVINFMISMIKTTINNKIIIINFNMNII